MLDPNNKKFVNTGDALGFIKFARLDSKVVKKILDNLKLTGKFCY
jgi:hypothetical protein